MAKKIKVSRFSAVGEPSPDSGKKILFVVAAIVLLLAGFTLGKVTSNKSSSTEAAKINNAKNSSIGDVKRSGSTQKTEGIVPVGFEKSSEGAVTAAISYVTLIPKLYFTSDVVLKSSAITFTTPTFTQGFLDAISTNRSTARDIYKADPDAFFREFPLSYFVDEALDDEVTVVVWSAFMLAARPDFDGKTESKIHVLKLVWENDDWKVDNWKTQAGPTPRWQAPSSTILTVDEFLTAIEPFKGGFDYVPSF